MDTTNIGKDIKNKAIMESVINLTPKGCIGGCPKCGDYMFEEKGESGYAVCCYCEHKQPLRTDYTKDIDRKLTNMEKEELH